MIKLLIDKVLTFGRGKSIRNMVKSAGLTGSFSGIYSELLFDVTFTCFSLVGLHNSLHSVDS